MVNSAPRRVGIPGTSKVHWGEHCARFSIPEPICWTS